MALFVGQPCELGESTRGSPAASRHAPAYSSHTTVCTHTQVMDTYGKNKKDARRAGAVGEALLQSRAEGVRRVTNILRTVLTVSEEGCAWFGLVGAILKRLPCIGALEL